jgi:hypothetical protein
LAEDHWYIIGEYAWRSVGEYLWCIVGECAWYIIGCLVTKGKVSGAQITAYHAQRLYLQSLDKAYRAESKSAVASWTMDKWDRTY